MTDVLQHPLFAPIVRFFLAPEFREEDEFLEARGKVFLPVGATSGCNVNGIFLQVFDRASVVGEGPVYIYQLIECPQCFSQFWPLV